MDGKPVFIDTMGWYSLLDRRDRWHREARALMERFGNQRTPLVTSDYVLDETATLLLVRGATSCLPGFFERVRSSRALKLMMVGAARFEEAVDYFLKHRDQGYSFTDVTSFLLMRELRIARVLSHDNHFERAGFDRLLV